jgi:hypothetical protein
MDLHDTDVALLRDGFFALDDPAIGARVIDAFEKPFVIENGLDICRANVLDNKVSKME